MVRLAHGVIEKELHDDKISYEIDEKHHTVTADTANLADLKKALYYERTRAKQCEDAFHHIEQAYMQYSPLM